MYFVSIYAVFNNRRFIYTRINDKHYGKKSFPMIWKYRLIVTWLTIIIKKKGWNIYMNFSNKTPPLIFLFRVTTQFHAIFQSYSLLHLVTLLSYHIWHSQFLGTYVIGKGTIHAKYRQDIILYIKNWNTHTSFLKGLYYVVPNHTKYT